MNFCKLVREDLSQIAPSLGYTTFDVFGHRLSPRLFLGTITIKIGCNKKRCRQVLGSSYMTGIAPGLVVINNCQSDTTGLRQVHRTVISAGTAALPPQCRKGGNQTRLKVRRLLREMGVRVAVGAWPSAGRNIPVLVRRTVRIDVVTGIRFRYRCFRPDSPHLDLCITRQCPIRFRGAGLYGAVRLVNT